MITFINLTLCKNRSICFSDSLSDTFSLSSSPSSTLKFDPKKSETKTCSYTNDYSKPTASLPKKQALPIETDAEERPKSFLHDEVM